MHKQKRGDLKRHVTPLQLNIYSPIVTAILSKATTIYYQSNPCQILQKQQQDHQQHQQE